VRARDACLLVAVEPEGLDVAERLVAAAVRLLGPVDPARLVGVKSEGLDEGAARELLAEPLLRDPDFELMRTEMLAGKLWDRAAQQEVVGQFVTPFGVKRRRLGGVVEDDDAVLLVLAGARDLHPADVVGADARHDQLFDGLPGVVVLVPRLGRVERQPREGEVSRPRLLGPLQDFGDPFYAEAAGVVDGEVLDVSREHSATAAASVRRAAVVFSRREIGTWVGVRPLRLRRRAC
jgi:hypothetical protein